MPHYQLPPMIVEAVCWDGTPESVAAIHALTDCNYDVQFQKQRCPFIPRQASLGLSARILFPSDQGCMVVKLPWGILVVSQRCFVEQWCAVEMPHGGAHPGSAFTDSYTSYAEQPCQIGGCSATRTVWP